MFSREKIKTKPEGLLNKSLLLVFILLFALVGTYLIINSFAVTSSDKSNLWVDQTTGIHNCTPAPGLGEDYNTAKSNNNICSDIQTALNNATSGQSISVKAGNYGALSLDSNKPVPAQGVSPITIYGETTPPGVKMSNLTTNGANYIVQDMIVDTGTAHNSGWRASGTNIKGKNIKLHGGYVSFYPSGSNNVTWEGGEFGEAGKVGLPRLVACNGSVGDDEPIESKNTTNLTIDGVIFYPQDADHTPSSCSMNGFHLEYIRLDNNTKGFTLKNSTFPNPANDNTSTIFITEVTNTSGAGEPQDLMFYNNFFGPDNGPTISTNDNIDICKNITFAYNTFKNSFGYIQHSGDPKGTPNGQYTTNGCSTVNNVLFVGNLGEYNTAAPCTGTHIKNMWQNQGSITCGSDRFISGPNNSTSNLGLGGTDGFHLISGSPAINFGETAYCASILGNKDHDGGNRSNGTNCDAGAHEFGSVPGGGGVDTGPKASLWVATTQDGGKSTCARASSPVSFETAKTNANVCNTINTAWGKCVASSSETIIIKANTNIYPSETITGDKADPGCRFVGEDGVRIASIFPQGAFFTLENVTIDYGNSHGNAVIVDGKDVTFKKVNLHGPYVNMKVQNGDRFTWQKGTFGKDGETPLERRCDTGDGDQPIWVDADDTTIDGIKFNKVKAAKGTDPTCGLDKTLHLEFIRVQGAKNLTVKNSWFLPGADVGSGHIFVTNHESSTTAASGLKVINNIFEPVVGSYSIQVHPNVKSCEWTFLYNTFYQDILFQCTRGDSIWAGNAGYLALNNTCTGTQIKNVYQRDYSGNPPVCGTNKYVSGPEYSVSALGFGTGGKLVIGSKAIDAGESLSESDYCTGTLVGAKDIDDDTRPQGTNCDAGADEFRSGTTPTPKLPGDVDGNKVVDIDDLSLLLINWKKNYPQADFVKDNIIDIDDLSILLINWGKRIEV